ncbi:MAG: sulfite exporter TauE/SafE family protein [Xanthobacteraceae bacterium]|nr:sulfite exporter TauE/SafE family protein [Xanthobacteraceae bacterium]
MDWAIISAAAFIIALASVLRGVTGFGFAVVATPLLALVLPPSVAVPVSMLLQIPAGLPIVITDWADTDFRIASIMFATSLPALIPGFYILAHASADVMRLIVGMTVVVSTVFLASGVRLDRPPRTSELFAAGAVSGLMQGAVAMSGPPVVVLFLASSWPIARCRATLSFFFLLLAVATLIVAFLSGLMTGDAGVIAIAGLPGLLVGQFLGARIFTRIDARRYRLISVLSVAATGLFVMIKGLAPYF